MSNRQVRALCSREDGPHRLEVALVDVSRGDPQDEPTHAGTQRRGDAELEGAELDQVGMALGPKLLAKN